MEIDRYTRNRLSRGSGVWSRIDDGTAGGEECWDAKAKAKAMPRVESKEGQEALAQIAKAVRDESITPDQAQALVDKLFPVK